jgi:hypothetical protein
LSRRDEFPGDWVEINIDSYHDQRTAFSFTLSVSGVRGDELFLKTVIIGMQAGTDMVAKTHVDDKAGLHEVKIPFQPIALW